MPLKSNNRRVSILKKIKKLKYLPFGKIFIDCKFDKLHYKLILLTNDRVEDIDIVKLLATWRKKHEKWFPAQFKITHKGTKIWLKNQVIDTVDRLLFIIRADNKYLGHVGLFRFNFDNLTCEIDNIIRGDRAYPGIMTNAITHMMDWGRKELGLRGYTLQTSSDNERALRLYRRIGFVEVKRIPAVHVKKNDKMEWIEAPKSYKGNIKRFFVYMKQQDL